MFSPHSIAFTTQGKPLRFHLFSTGMVADKSKLRTPRWQGPLATIDALFDPHFTEWLPIWVLVIEHPEGIFLIDTGERADVKKPGYFRSSGLLVSRFMTTQFKFDITRDQEIDNQLQNLQIPIKKVTAVFLTHLHFDHTDGLYHFPATPVYLHTQEWQHPHGALPKLYPPWFKPTLLDLGASCGPFKKARFLTKQQDIALVHTPGHTPGHCSILVKTDTCHILFAGDICYTETQLIQENFPANLASQQQAKQTYAAVKAYAHAYPLVFLPTHDPDAAQRLSALQTLSL
jgi:glyoxylase-like metal-dependent hydrolase (beta-lactamase superfamily II)